MDKHLEILHQLGESLYEMGEYTAAALCFKEAAHMFHPAAQFGYARSLEWGLGVEVNFSEAFVWYERAAQLGDVKAMCRMGDIERNGERGAPDAEAAFGWYLKAAEAGYPPAMEYVASCYVYGCGVAADLKEAAWWWYKAAKSIGKLTPQQVVTMERSFSTASGEAALQAGEEPPQPADKR